MKRRDFIYSTTLSLTGCLLSKSAFSRFINKNSNISLGIILSTLKNELKNDPENVFRQLAEIGYTFIEGVGRYGIPAETSMKYIRQYNLKAIASGDSIYKLLNQTDKYLELIQSNNMDYMVCYWPWLDGAKNLTRKQTLEAAENLNKIGKICYQNDIQFAWHNHDKEFLEIEGETPFDLIMQNTNPEYVKSELDVYWVKKAGKNPVQVIEEYQNRIGMLHLKDMADDEEKSKTCPGSGIIDFEPFIEKQKETGIDYLIVEHEGNKQGVECAKTSYEYLNGF